MYFIDLDIQTTVPWGIIKMMLDESVKTRLPAESHRTVRLVVINGGYRVVRLQNTEYMNAVPELIRHFNVERVPETVIDYALE